MEELLGAIITGILLHWDLAGGTYRLRCFFSFFCSFFFFFFVLWPSFFFPFRWPIFC
ncbi:hypothetical protein EDB82DRAFT_514031 [Fusarium venenatum]|uniref:uncharacterized protein n=1 Tax=Fusarium venenatum TaxID=56646 RepID=UPI001D41197B|nr:hypothetical protein EDB82DRAFT_514031 [Fusarium venenatum]